MTQKITVAIRSAGRPWVPVSELAEGQGGSMSSTPADGPREVIHFGWLDGYGGPGVWRSVGGVDVEVGMLRATVPLNGMDQLADLAAVGEYEIDVVHPRMGPITVRFGWVGR